MRRALLAIALLGAACTPAVQEVPGREDEAPDLSQGGREEAHTEVEEEGSTRLEEQVTTTTTTRPAVMDVGDPRTLARVLVAAERTIRDPDVPPEKVETWGRAQQDAYRLLATNRHWRPVVRELVPDDLRHAYDANLGASGELSDLTAPQEDLPDWTILTPRPPEELLGYYREAEEEFGVGWEYLAAIHFVETRMGRIRGNSPAGARGPMQFIPSTWDTYGEGDIDDDGDAIRAAARYLAARGAPQDMPSALHAYNPSRHYVTAIEAYASVMQQDPRAYYGYYHWQVYYRLASETVLLPEGWEREGNRGEGGG